MDPTYRSESRPPYLPLALFGIAFGYLEAAVVVYLRRIYYPDGFGFPLTPFMPDLWAVELGREAATIVMLGTAAWLAGRTRWERFGHFAFLFGLWDIAFYLGLVLTLGWPESIMTWDILFLLPLPWTGPVLSPVLVSALIIAAGVGIAFRERRGRPITVGRVHWILGLLSLALLLYSFMANHAVATAGGVPESFPWFLFGAGWLIGAGLAADVVRRG
ncbi:MAG: hypothetical protein ABIK65_15890 [Candidatus Eisenbacteria bacterium]